MKIPFLDYFKRPKAAPAAVPVPPVPIVTIEKPASERFGKTVLPNVTRFVGVESAGEFPLEAQMFVHGTLSEKHAALGVSDYGANHRDGR